MHRYEPDDIDALAELVALVLKLMFLAFFVCLIVWGITR